jgi:hypothetical protein
LGGYRGLHPDLPPRRIGTWRGLPALALAALLTGGTGASAAAQQDPYALARLRHPRLFEVYYDHGLLEYCGLLTREARGGFVLRRDDLLLAQPLSADEYRNVRVAAGIAVDMEYDNRGLGGQRLWCRTEGIDAYNRFVTRYRREPGNLPVMQ